MARLVLPALLLLAACGDARRQVMSSASGLHGVGASAIGEAGATLTNSFELKNLRETNICAQRLLMRAEGFQDTNGHMTFIATSLSALVLKLINDLKVPLHRTFLINVQLAVAGILRVAWMQTSALSSPYFHAFHSAAVTLAQHAIEQWAATTGELVDAGRLREGTPILAGLAVRSAEKTAGLMQEWRRIAQARLQKKADEIVHLSGDTTQEKARVSDDLNLSEEEDRLGDFKEEVAGTPKTKKEKTHWTNRLAESLSKINDPNRLTEELNTQKAWLKTGKMLPLLTKDMTNGEEVTISDDGKVLGGNKADIEAVPDPEHHLPLSESFLQVDAGPNAWLAALAMSRSRRSVNVEAAPSPRQPTIEEAAYLAAAWNQTPLVVRQWNQTTMPNVTTAAVFNMTGLGRAKFPSLLQSARALAGASKLKLEQLQEQVAGVAKIRFFLNKAQLMLGNLAVHVAGLKGDLACVRQELEESMESGVVLPTWLVKLYGIVEFNGSVVWRLMLAILASKGSGHSVSQRLLHACDTYALLLWQSLMARAAQLSPLGLYGGVQFLGTFQKPFANIEDPRLILPG